MTAFEKAVGIEPESALLSAALSARTLRPGNRGAALDEYEAAKRASTRASPGDSQRSSSKTSATTRREP